MPYAALTDANLAIYKHNRPAGARNQANDSQLSIMHLLLHLTVLLQLTLL